MCCHLYFNSFAYGANLQIETRVLVPYHSISAVFIGLHCFKIYPNVIHIFPSEGYVDVCILNTLAENVSVMSIQKAISIN